MRRVTAAIALALCGCAHAPAPVAPPRLQMPALAAEACALYRLPPGATASDLEVGFARRGEQLALCEEKRRLAVETAAAQQALQDAWAPARKPPHAWFSRGRSAAGARSRP